MGGKLIWLSGQTEGVPDEMLEQLGYAANDMIEAGMTGVVYPPVGSQKNTIMAVRGITPAKISEIQSGYAYAWRVIHKPSQGNLYGRKPETLKKGD